MLKDPKQPWYSNYAENTDRSEASQYALKLADTLENDTFTFTLSPLHSGQGSLPDFNKLEIVTTPNEFNDEKTYQKIFHVGRVILEVYACEGLYSRL